MKTYQDLLELGDNETARIEFVQQLINSFANSAERKRYLDDYKYYDGENVTIARYEKLIYDITGRAYADMFTANHKIASSFYGFVVDQEVSYLLGNGITFGDKTTKDKLGTVRKSIDKQVYKAVKDGIITGESFAFWNKDHLEIFDRTEFIPLYDEENGSLRAGIRFWQIDSTKPLRAELYEESGYTHYIRRQGEEMTTLQKKRPYILKIRTSEIDGTEIYGGENYKGFPIVPFRRDSNARSELRGKQNTVDALDLATSNMVNNVDEGNLIYWVLTNAGGMDDIDDQKFIDRVKTLHVVHGDGDTTAEPRTIEAPFAGTQATIDTLTRRLYTDFQAFDSAAVMAGNQTATAIRAAYIPLDLKCDKLEMQVTEFLKAIMELAGVDDEPSYTRNKIINTSEEIQAVLMGAQYFDDEYLTKKLLTILGDSDQFDELQKRKASDEYQRFNGGEDTTEDETDTENTDQQEPIDENTETGE